MAIIKKRIKDEYFPKPVKEQPPPVPDDAEHVVTDVKTTLMFEPFYEGEGDANPPATSDAAGGDQVESQPKQDRRP